MNCFTTVPARACSFAAVIRIWNAPGTRLSCKLRKVARPLESVVARSVCNPLANTPPGPSTGAWKLTRAPATGRPAASVTSMVNGLAACEPAE
jgi:hypothetical protein